MKNCLKSFLNFLDFLDRFPNLKIIPLLPVRKIDGLAKKSQVTHRRLQQRVAKLAKI